MQFPKDNAIFSRHARPASCYRLGSKVSLSGTGNTMNQAIDVSRTARTSIAAMLVSRATNARE